MADAVTLTSDDCSADAAVEDGRGGAASGSGGVVDGGVGVAWRCCCWLIVLLVAGGLLPQVVRYVADSGDTALSVGSWVASAFLLVGVVLLVLECFDIRKATNRPNLLCVVFFGSCAASAPLIRALLDLWNANGFRIAGDMMHNFAAVFVLTRVVSQRSVAGLSWHSAVLYVLVFSTRYLDLVTMWYVNIPDGMSIWDFVSVYNTVLKLLYLGTAYGLLLSFVICRDTYDAENDRFCKLAVVVRKFTNS